MLSPHGSNGTRRTNIIASSPQSPVSRQVPSPRRFPTSGANPLVSRLPYSYTSLVHRAARPARTSSACTHDCTSHRLSMDRTATRSHAERREPSPRPSHVGGTTRRQFGSEHVRTFFCATQMITCALSSRSPLLAWHSACTALPPRHIGALIWQNIVIASCAAIDPIHTM